MSTRARTRAACDASVASDPHFATAVKAGYLEGAIEQALLQLEGGHSLAALHTLRMALTRFPSVGDARANGENV